MSGDFVLATCCTEPDQAFPTMRTLARAVHQARKALPGNPGLKLTPASLGRAGDLPGGACLAIRAQDGTCGGHGRLIGYAFTPHTHASSAIHELLAAIRELAGQEKAETLFRRERAA